MIEKPKETIPQAGTGLTREILDCVADGVFTVDREFRITSFNRAAERITGVDRAEAIGMRCCDVFRANICEDTCAIKETFRTDRPVVNRAVSIVRSDGTRVPISVSAALLTGKFREVLGGVETFRDLSLVEDLRRELSKKTFFHDIVSKNAHMQELFGLLPEVGRSGSAVLIRGASGTGKELFARAVHDLSPRRDGPFIVVNCAAIPEPLLASELFGCADGVCEDGGPGRGGRLAAAAGGTIFLDEIADLSAALQARLLRALQEKIYVPRGAGKPLTVDVRVIVATNRDLASMVEAGDFRQDLFFHLCVIRLDIPPLKDRKEDIPLLLDHFVARLARLTGKDIADVTDQALSALMAHDWPGNVRELMNALEYAFVVSPGGLIGLEHLPRELQADAGGFGPAPATLDDAEARFIREVLAKNRGNRAATARQLGVHKTTLWRKMKRYGIG